MKKAVCIIAAIAIITAAPFYAFAYDEAYIKNPEIWLDTKILTKEIEDTRIDGIYQYYIDSESHTLYCHISHNANIYNCESDVVFTGIDFGYETHFEFNEKELKNELIKTNLRFENNKNEIYFAVDFKDKEFCKSKNNLNITIRINDVVYLICEELIVDFTVNEKTTEKKQKSETTTKIKTEKERQAKEKSSKSTKESTTKFKYSGNNTIQSSTVHNDDTIEEFNTEANNIITAEEYSHNQTTQELSLVSKILLAVSGLMIIIGIGFLLSAAVHTKHTENSDEEDKK